MPLALLNVEHLVSSAGYPLLFLIVMAESSGAPVPGETGLITAAVLASQGKLHIELVIPLAAAAAIVIGEPFFERHGPKAVFFGRFLLGLRVWASWLAGATRMPWRSFVLWNALGGIVWASAIGLIAYFLGHSASNAIQAFGIYGLIALLIAIVSFVVLHRRGRRGRKAGAGEGTGAAEERPEG